MPGTTHREGLHYPKWNGSFDKGHDVGLFKLPRPVDGPVPSLENSSIQVSNRTLFRFGLDGVIQVGAF